MKTARKLMLSALIAVGLGSSYAFAYGPGDCGPMRGENMQQRMVERMEQHQKALHDALKLSGEQEAAWNAYIARMKPGAGRPERPKAEDMAKLTTPERLDRMVEMSKLHLKAAEERAAAAKSFYGSLSAEQKKVFDDHHAQYGKRRSGGDQPRPRG